MTDTATMRAGTSQAANELDRRELAEDDPVIVDLGRVHFLDGARGWAAVAVAYGHFEFWLSSVAESSGYGIIHDLIYTSPLGLATDVAASLFFVISGFALSLPILISKNPKRTLRNMAVYRYFRLTIPILATCTLAYGFWHAGVFFNGAAGRLSGSEWFAKFYQFEHGAPTVVRFSLFDVYFGDIAPRDTWNNVLWTMAIQMIGSFALFAFLAVFRSTKIRIALALVAAGVLGASAHVGLGQYVGSYFGFPAGYLAAEFAVHSPPLTKLRRAGPALLASALAFGIFSVTPMLPRRITHAIDAQSAMNLCAFGLFAGILLSTRAQAVLSTPLSRFMGNISFSLYLTHFLMLCTVGAGLYVFASRHDWAVMPTLIVVVVVTTVSFFAVAACFNAIVQERILVPVKRVLLALVDWLSTPAPESQRPSLPNR